MVARRNQSLAWLLGTALSWGLVMTGGAFAQDAKEAPPAEDASATVSPSRAIVGTVISYSIEHFPATKTVSLTLHGPSGTPLPLGSVQTDAAGSASGTFVLPASPGGVQTIRFVPDSDTGQATSGSGAVDVDF